ncbi:MAG: transglycosylase protein [Actinomycetota bacterium]|nr:transglycosylase protein [Actinomycetota bacterium]
MWSRRTRSGGSARRRWRARGRSLVLLFELILVSALMGPLASVFVLPLAASAGWAVNSGTDYFDSLPSELASSSLPQRSVLLAANGAPVTYFFDENRVEVPLTAIAPVLRQAVVAVEDSRFYQHGGVDVRGILRAAVVDGTGGQIQGASTLSQQYVKNVLLEQALMAGDRTGARAAVEKTATRKIKEMRLALALDDVLSKEQILQAYLNIVYFGGPTYGVEAAAQRYLGVRASQVTLPQAALLAGMIVEPGSYDPQRRPKAARNRRDIVLARMLDQKMITPAEYASAVAAPVSAPGRQPRHGCTATGVHGYFCDFVLRTLLTDPAYASLGTTAAQRMTTVNRGGLIIRTTLDARLQERATEAVHTAVPPQDSDGLGAAAVTVEPGTGRVLAMTQNSRYAVATAPGATSVNYSADQVVGGGSGFQTGSSFKPFTVAAWLESGRSLGDTVDATKRAFPYSAFTSCGRRLRGTRPYEPGNAEGGETGTMSVLQSTYNSVNVAFVDMESQLDLCDITDVAGRLGVHLAVPGADCGPSDVRSTELPACLPSLTLGVKEIAPLTMAAAYAGFASGGTYCRPFSVTSVYRAGALPRAPAVAPGTWVPVPVPGRTCSRALDPDVAGGVNDALRQVFTKGTAAGVGPLRRWPSAGKTGTTDGPYDSWFVGYTAQRSTAVWVADPGRRGKGGAVVRRRLTGVTVAGRSYGTLYGATLAAPLWKDVMTVAMKGLPPEPLP